MPICARERSESSSSGRGRFERYGVGFGKKAHRSDSEELSKRLETSFIDGGPR